MKLLHDASIKSAVFRAASRAALREEDKRIINHNDHQSNDLQSVIEEEINKSMSRTSCKEDFVAFTMYNWCIDDLYDLTIATSDRHVRWYTTI